MKVNKENWTFTSRWIGGGNPLAFFFFDISILFLRQISTTFFCLYYENKAIVVINTTFLNTTQNNVD